MLQDQSRNRTLMPEAQAPGAAPPDTGPARAEAGIAAMLAEEPTFVLPAQMPSPGSPEAVALHKAVCTEFDRRTHLTDAEYARLKIGDTHTLWTRDTVREVMAGDYSSLMGNEAYAANEKTPAELQELLILTTQRERQFEEAQRDLKLHEVHTLVYPADEKEAWATEGEDPILAVIREHKAAYAAWLPHLRATSEAPMGTPGYYALEAAAEPSLDRECEAYDALLEQLPTTLEGLIALASYLPGAVLRNSCTNADDDAMHALGAMCDAVKELAKAGMIGAVCEVLDAAASPPLLADPILAAIEASGTAQAAMQRWSAGFKTRPMSKADFAEEDRLNKVQVFAHDTVIATVPTTAAGRLALLDYLRWQMGLFGMADGNPPEAGSAFWPDAYRALKAALAFDGTGHDPVVQQPEAKFTACSIRNLARLYDTFSAHWRVFSQGMGAPFCWDGDNYGTAGQILDAECDRLARIMDDIVREMQARQGASKGERDERLGVLMRHEFECNGRIHDTGLLVDVNTAWGA